MPQVKRTFFVDKFALLSQKHGKNPHTARFSGTGIIIYLIQQEFNLTRETANGFESTIAFEKLVKYTELPTDPQS